MSQHEWLLKVSSTVDIYCLTEVVGILQNDDPLPATWSGRLNSFGRVWALVGSS